MALGSITNAYEVWKDHDFSRKFQFRLISMDGCPDYVKTELLDKPTGLGGWLYWNSASIPGRKITDMPLKYQGFTFHVPGPVEYSGSWKVDFKVPGDFLVRNALERWSFETYNEETSCGNFSIPCPSSTIDIGLIDNKCRIIRQYRLVGVYPSDIGEISYDQTSTEIASFPMTWAYQWWRPVEVTLEENDAGETSTVDNIFGNYHNQISTNTSNCSPIDALRSLS